MRSLLGASLRPGTSPVGHTDCDLTCPCGRYVEIWNLVFMQFNRDGAGVMTPLPSPSIDTGMGLERIACVVQGVRSNYDTDLFVPLIQEASRLTGVPYGQDENRDVSLRIAADHSRACAFLIHDGIVPGNEGRGYVLRKILRRAIRHGKMLGTEQPFLYTLTSLVAELMKDAYPELQDSREYAATVVKHEEEKFSSTLSLGMSLFDDIAETVTQPGQAASARGRAVQALRYLRFPSGSGEGNSGRAGSGRRRGWISRRAREAARTSAGELERRREDGP